MQLLDLERNKGSVHAPSLNAIKLPGFYRATDGSVCTNRCGVLISVSPIAGTDAVRVRYGMPIATPELYEVSWEEECATHEAMMNILTKMCVAAVESSRS